MSGTSGPVDLDRVRARLADDREQIARLQGAADPMRDHADAAESDALRRTRQRAALLSLLAPTAAAHGQSAELEELMAEFGLDRSVLDDPAAST